MNKLKLAVVAFGVVGLLGGGTMAAATTTEPSQPSLADGPFLISAYSVQGSNLRYIQLSNISKEIAALDGWTIQTQFGTSTWQLDELNGYVESGKKVTMAESAALPGATFTFKNTAPTGQLIEKISLIPPSGSGYNLHTIDVEIKASTPIGENSTPPIYYFQRNTSSSTGNYISGYTALSTAPTTIISDNVYFPNTTTPLQIIELYPNASSCSPANETALCYDYVKIFNSSGQPIDLSKYRLRTGSVNQSATNSNTTQLSGQLAAGGYVTFRVSLTDDGSNVWLEDTYGLMVYAKTSVTYPSSSNNEGQAWSYNASVKKWQWTKYPTPTNTVNRFTANGAMNTCENLRLSEIGANYSPQFIEVYNPTNKTIDISGCQLETNRSAVASYVFAKNTKLAANQHVAINVTKTDLSLIKTTSGTVYIVSADGTDEVDARTYENLAENTSWALVNGVWRQTFAVTPSAENAYQEYPACESGYYRNSETGRCNKIALASTPTPCKDGYYRNKETNRCRKIASSSSTLTPCKTGYYRNAATNRCRKISSTASTLKPCKEGYERNPETNRCRKVQSATYASAGDIPYAVETVPAAAGNIVGWWLFGGVLLAGAGYGAWEWRGEIARLFSRSKK